jgi:hypothetical protein
VNELYEKTIEVDGKTYWYDPDHDCYHRINAPMSTWDKYSWIVGIVLLSIVCVYVEFFIK